MPIPRDQIFEAAQGIFDGIDQIRELFSDTTITSARLVVNPEKMVIEEARRTYTYLSLFGYGVDGVVVNRVLPDEVSDPYFSRWRTIQAGHLRTVDEAFRDVPRPRLRLFDDEMVGIDRLRVMAKELYGETDPVTGFVAHSPFRLREVGEKVILDMDVPFAERSDVEVFRHATELYLQVGPYRRSILLPDSLQRRQVLRARLEEGILRVEFAAGEKTGTR